MSRPSLRTIGAGIALSLVAALAAMGISAQASRAAAVEQPSAAFSLPTTQTAAVKIAADTAAAVPQAAKPKLSTITTTRATSTTQTTRRATKVARRAATLATAGSELSQARSILAGLIARYPIIKGATVSMGPTPNDYQAVCYYKTARIVVNPDHTASLTRILDHEVWHIIDWRDNGRIDWGENVPR